jgi:broad specificity phosphatase PhoE
VERAYLVRHGESEFSVRGLTNGDPSVGGGLTETGRMEARQLGEALADTPLDLCAVSEFARARETAELALAGREVPRLVLGGLNDIAVGAFEGDSIEEYRGWARSHEPTEPPPGGGESRVGVVSRYVEAYRTLLRRAEPSILVVAHALTVRYVVDAARGLVPAPRVETVPYAEPFALTAAELSRALDLLAAWTRAPVWRR